MLSFFRRGSTSSSPSTERAAPPSAQQRRDKEQRWFNNLKPTSNSNSTQTTPQRNATNHKPAPARSGDSLHYSPGPVGAAEAWNPPSGASLKSRGSRLFQLGSSPQNQPDRYKHSSEPNILPTKPAAYAASAPNPNARGGRTSPPPPLPHQTNEPPPPPPTTDSNTKSLATRLQELATSHSDGLLDDEEYRLLRTELFDRYAAKSSQPTQNKQQPTFATLGKAAMGKL